MADLIYKTWGPSGPQPEDSMRKMLVKGGTDPSDWLWVETEAEEATARNNGYAIYGETVWPQAEEMAIEPEHAPPVISDELKAEAAEFKPRRGRPRKDD